MDGEIEEVPDAGDGDLQAAPAGAAPVAPAGAAPLAPAGAANDTMIDMGDEVQQPNGNPWTFQRMIVEENRFWRWLSYLLAIFAIYSSVVIPLNCAFVVDDISTWILYCFEVLFGLDVVRQFIRVFTHLERPDLRLFLFEIGHHPRKILEFSPFIPWSCVTQSKYVPWLKIARALRVKDLFEKLEKFRERYYHPFCFLKLTFIQVYCVHLTACIFYLQAADSKGLLDMKKSWLSNVQLTEKNLTEMGIAQLYAVSLYYASVSLSTVGYGDIHPVNVKEMIVIIVLPIFSLFVWTYLGFSIANLFSRKSRTSIVKEKMAQLDEYFERENVGEELCREIREYMLIKYNQENENKAIEDVPAFLRIKIGDAFNVGIINQLPLFHGCSLDFRRHLAVKFDQELYASGSTVAEENIIMKELKILYLGNLRQLHEGTYLQDHVRPTHIFGLESLLLNEALPNTFQASELSRVLSLRKRVFLEILETYSLDATIVMNNVRMDKDLCFLERLNFSDFGLRLEDDDRIKSSLLNNAIFSGKFAKVTSLVQSGVSVNVVDYNNRSPLHVAASVGNVEITKFLIQNGADVNKKDSSGATPLLEALSNKNDRVVELLLRRVAYLGEEVNGEYLCKIILENKVALLRSILKQKVNPNFKNRAGQTPLHIAASGGKYDAAKLLISYGADTTLEDRWGRLPIQEAVAGGHEDIICLLIATI